MPKPLRSQEDPVGLRDLQGYHKIRLDTDNLAAEFILEELHLHQDRGGGSGRENPANSPHWATPTEVRQLESLGVPRLLLPVQQVQEAANPT